MLIFFYLKKKLCLINKCLLNWLNEKNKYESLSHQCSTSLFIISLSLMWYVSVYFADPMDTTDKFQLTQVHNTLRGTQLAELVRTGMGGVN